jgi:hypothetical protein
MALEQAPDTSNPHPPQADCVEQVRHNACSEEQNGEKETQEKQEHGTYCNCKECAAMLVNPFPHLQGEEWKRAMVKRGREIFGKEIHEKWIPQEPSADIPALVRELSKQVCFCTSDLNACQKCVAICDYWNKIASSYLAMEEQNEKLSLENEVLVEKLKDWGM